jgi:hypothetical protein
MQNTCLLGIACAVAAAQACSSNTDAPVESARGGDSASAAGSVAVSKADRATTDSSSAAAKPWEPPPPSAGYTRLEVPMVHDLTPGSDNTFCQFIQAPLDHDVDVLDVEGFQSSGGHHAVAYASSDTTPVGTSRRCTEQDNVSQGGFLGGIGGEASGGVKLPEGVAFRLPKGNSILLNTHFINTTDKTLDGRVAIDFKFVEVDSKRIIASLFSNGNSSFNVAAHGDGIAMAECTLPRAFKFILFTNHMHGQGSYAKTELVHADGRVDLVHEDADWVPEMQFKAVYSKWTVEQPLIVDKGDMLRTQCNWQNQTDSALMFPAEMCFGTGFFLSDGSSSPVCLEGRWLER